MGQQVIHMAPPAERVPHLMNDLFGWMANTDAHPLIAFMLRMILDTVTAFAPQVSPQVPPQVGELLAAIRGEMGREALQSALGLSGRKSFRGRYLKPALADGLIEMTIPDKPNSRLQKYQLTDRGRQWPAQHGDG